MKLCKKQLMKYYKDQGFTGSRLNYRVRKDMQKVVNYFGKDKTIPDYSPLSELFFWEETTEGFDYWFDRNIAA